MNINITAACRDATDMAKPEIAKAFKTLGVLATATHAEIKAAHRKLALNSIPIRQAMLMTGNSSSYNKPTRHSATLDV